MKKIALISDVRDWAFDVNNRDIERYALTGCKVDHLYVNEFQKGTNWPSLDTYDVIFMPYHRWHLEKFMHVPYERCLSSLRSRWTFPEKPGIPTAEAFKLVNQFVRYHVVTMESFNELKLKCSGVVYLTNPVNTELFKPSLDVSDEIVCEWNGNARHCDPLGNEVKGFDTIIVPACRQAAVKLVSAEYNTTRISHDQMPLFYSRASVALSASLYEGASNSVMESMASGLALISTDVGNAREMHESQIRHFSDSGIVLVDRNIESFVKALKELKAKGIDRIREMGRMNAEEISQRWSWNAWADRYRTFFLKSLT